MTRAHLCAFIRWFCKKIRRGNDGRTFLLAKQDLCPTTKQLTSDALQMHGKDRSGRTLADGLLPEGTNVNHSLVKDGWCWWYRKYAPGDTVLEGLEWEAREAKNGLWANPAPIPPWIFRKAKRDARVHLVDTSNPLPTGRKFWLGLLG